MSAPQQRTGIRDFYVETVLPALAANLDSAFPEFGWRRDARGWVATNQEMTHRVLGVRADRVVAHGDAPAGFLVHGSESTLWTAYVNGGQVPRAAEFTEVVRDLARRAGVDPAALDRPAPPQDRGALLLETFAQRCAAELASDQGAQARDYLVGRGLPADYLESCCLGVVPRRRDILDALHSEGFTDQEIAAAGVLADGRWQGRVVGAWRGERGRIGTMWARSVDPFAAPDSKYLYLKGTSRTGLPPYGLDDVVRGPTDERREIVLVEGLLDVHQLRSRGMRSVAAVGGTAVPPSTFEHLARLGVESVTLAFDNDAAGRAATAKAVEASCRAKASPAVCVLEPGRLGESKDPDAFVRDHGIDAFQDLCSTVEPGITWRANELLVANPSAMTRQTALARAGRWLGTLPPRLALEQEDAVKFVADRCGYSTEATVRAFQARFWQEQSVQPTHRTHEVDLSPGGR